jgi:hypothetical protein
LRFKLHRRREFAKMLSPLSDHRQMHSRERSGEAPARAAAAACAAVEDAVDAVVSKP